MLQALDDESCVFVHLGFRVDALVTGFGLTFAELVP